MSFVAFCRDGNLQAAKYAFKLSRPCPTQLNEAAFVASTYGRLRVLKWLVKRGTQLTNLNLGQAARFGHFRVFRWMLSKFSAMDVHDCFEYPFRYACYFDHLKIMKWTWAHYKPIHSIDYSGILFSAVSMGSGQTGKMLWRLKPVASRQCCPKTVQEFCKRRSLQLITFY